MMYIYELNDENFQTFALQNYQNPRGNEIEDFYDDLNRLKYIKRLINKYQENGKLSSRLLMNHIIIFFNSFGIQASLRIFEYKMPEHLWPVIKPFLRKLNYIDDYHYTDVIADEKIVNEIRNI